MVPCLHVGAEVCSGVEQPVSHEAEAAPTQQPPVPQPDTWTAAAGRCTALTLQYQEVREQLELWVTFKKTCITYIIVNTHFKVLISMTDIFIYLL